MSSYSLTILGTDFIGLSLAQTFVQEFEGEKISLVGQSPTDRQLEDLSELFSPEHQAELDRFPEAFEGEDNIRSVVTQTTENLRGQLGFLGGKIVDLKVDNDGFVLLVREENGDLRELYSHHLIATAPPMLDVLDRSFHLPGSDSAVTGLLLDNIGLAFNDEGDLLELPGENGPRVWDFDLGLEVDENGGTTNMKISGTGQAAAGVTTTEQLRGLVERFENLPEPNQHYSKSFDKSGWEDTSMPEGFVETKTKTLRDLLDDVLSAEEDPDVLTQKLEGLAGEVDSYSRFRSDPDLQRLRWKTLTAMNFAKPFITSDQTATAR